MRLNLQHKERCPSTHTAGQGQLARNTPFWLHNSKTSSELHHSQQKQPSAGAGKGQAPNCAQTIIFPLDRVKNREGLGVKVRQLYRDNETKARICLKKKKYLNLGVEEYWRLNPGFTCNKYALYH